jgi:hypothetical protein
VDQKNFIYNPQTFLWFRSFFHTFISEMVLVQWHFLRDDAVSDKEIKRNLFWLRTACELMMWFYQSLHIVDQKNFICNSQTFLSSGSSFLKYGASAMDFLRDGAVSEKKINRNLCGLRKACELMTWSNQSLHIVDRKNFICNPQIFLCCRSFFHTFIS